MPASQTPKEQVKVTKLVCGTLAALIFIIGLLTTVFHDWVKTHEIAQAEQSVETFIGVETHRIPTPNKINSLATKDYLFVQTSEGTFWADTKLPILQPQDKIRVWKNARKVIIQVKKID